MSHTSGNILPHLIFSTQGRRPLIKPEFRHDLFAYLGGPIREVRGTALIINGTADHVHVLVSLGSCPHVIHGDDEFAGEGARATPSTCLTALSCLYF